MSSLKQFFSLTKPGVLFGNVITAGAGFFLASAGQIDIWLFLALMLGTTLVIASACVTNNVLDQDIDSRMERTQKRAMVTQTVPKNQASIFAALLAILGMTILYGWTNSLVVAIGIIGWIVYVWLYGMLSKRKSVHGTLVGAVSGAMPIVAGYVAVRGAFDAGAVIVFIVLAAWQMPEFYSIGIYRLKEYKAAGVPILPVIKGVPRTITEIFIYTCIFVIASLLLTPFGYTGYSYLAVMAVFGAYWLWLGYKGFKAEDKDIWARKMFKFSLTMLLLFSAMISVGPLLP